MSIYGQLISNSDVEMAVIGTLQTWLPAYLAETERQKAYAGGLGFLARPRSWQAAYDFDNWQEGQMPAVIVVCNGTSSLERFGSGSYNAWFEVVAGCLLADTTETATRQVTHLYQAAIEGVLNEKGSLGGFASSMQLVGRETRLPDESNRTLAIAETTFRVFVEDIVQRPGGPAVPPTPSTALVPDLPEVEEVNVIVTAS